MSSQTTNAKKQMYERERSPSPSPEPHEYKQREYQGYQVPSKDSYFFDRCDQPMVEICEATNYFQLLPDEIKFPMLQFICEQSHEGPSVYGEYDAPLDWETVESINGKGGYFLKMTAEAANIYLIWHNRQKNIYKFWGPSERAVRDAMNRIRGRIVKYVVHGETSAHGENSAHGETSAHAGSVPKAGAPSVPMANIASYGIIRLEDSWWGNTPPCRTGKPLTNPLSRHGGTGRQRKKVPSTII